MSVMNGSFNPLAFVFFAEMGGGGGGRKRERERGGGR